MRAPRPRSKFGKALVRWREKRDMKGVDLARAFECDVTTISKYEHEQVPSVSLLLFLEWDLVPPVPYRELRRHAAPLMRSHVVRKWERERARILRVIREAREGGTWYFD